MTEKKVVPGTGGDQYLPYENRTGGESVVFFTQDLSAAGLVKIYGYIQDALKGRVAVKLHTGEKNGPNIIPRDWVKELLRPGHHRKAPGNPQGQRLDVFTGGYYGCGRGGVYPGKGREMVYGDIRGKDLARV